MPKLSIKNKDRISEQILYYLFSIFPQSLFTVDIAKELARDEEFVKILLKELESKNLVLKIDKNPQGTVYTKRLRWRLSSSAHEVYSKHQ